MKNVLILEDQEIIADRLRKIIQQIDDSIKIYSVDNIRDAFAHSMEGDIDLFLIDIVLNPKNPADISGLTFAEDIRSIEKYKFSPIIVISSLEDPRLYAYSQIHCYRYIEKPFDSADTKKTIKEALQYKKHTPNKEKYIYRKGGILYSVNLEDVIYIKTQKKTVTMHTEKENIIIPYIPVAKLINELNHKNFIQCNRACIVNKKYVESIDIVNRYIKIKKEIEYIEIGTSIKKNFLRKFNND